MFNKLKLRIHALLYKSTLENDLDAELRFHLEREIEENIARGMNREEARYAALRSFGGVERVKEESRDTRGVRFLEEFKQDIQYGIRIWMRTPGLTIAILLTLTLGIGANTVIFSVINGVLLKALPYPNWDRIVRVNEETPDGTDISVAYPNYLEWRKRQTLFESFAAFQQSGIVLTGGGDAERLTGNEVTANFFKTLGVIPQIGRTFSEEEDRPGGNPVVIISHDLWQRRFNGESSIIGKKIELNKENWTIIGVLPATFDFYGVNSPGNDYFRPLNRMADLQHMRSSAHHPGIRVVGRLFPNISQTQADAELKSIATQIARENPNSDGDHSPIVEPFLESYVGGVKSALYLIQFAAFLVLLIVCANVGNLMINRSIARKKEIATRAALGAGRYRVVRQLLTEYLILSVVAGLFGLILAYLGNNLLLKFIPEGLPRIRNINIDSSVLIVTLLITLCIPFIFGLYPALQASASALQDIIKQGNSSTFRNKLRNIMVVFEVSFILLILFSTLLLVKSYSRLSMIRPGFDSENRLTMRVRLSDGNYKSGDKILAALAEIKQGVSSLPGVEQVTFATGFPMRYREDERGYRIADRPEPLPRDIPSAAVHYVGSNYHKTLNIKLLNGRSFTEYDNRKTKMVVIVDEEFVKKVFPHSTTKQIIGKHLTFYGEDVGMREIVGIAQSVKQFDVIERVPGTIYMPYLQMNADSPMTILRAMDLIVTTSTNPETLIPSIKKQISAVDKDIALAYIMTLDKIVKDHFIMREFILTLMNLFTILAITLGCMGVYSVLAYIVMQRNRDIGIRIALGADSKVIIISIIVYGMSPVFIGTIIGSLAALPVSALFKDLLFGIAPTDPLTFLFTGMIVIALALIACWIPARRAAKVDPIIALRCE